MDGLYYFLSLIYYIQYNKIYGEDSFKYGQVFQKKTTGGLMWDKSEKFRVLKMKSQ